MVDLSCVRQMLRGRVEDGGKMTVIFKLQEPRLRDAVDDFAAAKVAVACRHKLSLAQAFHAPIETVSRIFAAGKKHHLVELAMGGELGISDCKEQGDVALRADRICVFGVPHGSQFQASTSSSNSDNPAPNLHG